MSVVNGQLANQTTFNNAFMSRTSATTQTVAKVALENADVVSGAFVENVQRAINKAFEAVGATGETDATINDYSSTNYISNGDNRKVAVGKLDAQLKTTQDEVDAAEADITSLDARLDTIETSDSTFGGNKIFTGNVTIQGSATILGPATEILTDNTVIEDSLVTYNKNGNDLSAEGSGFETERPSGNAGLLFDSALASFYKIGLLSNLREVIVSGVAQVVAGLKDFTSGIKTNLIDESTLDAGVTVETVLIKDGLVDGRDVSADGAVTDASALELISQDGRLDTIETGNSTFAGDKSFTGNSVLKNALINEDLFLDSLVNTQTGALVQLSPITAPVIKLTGAGLASIERIAKPATNNKFLVLINQSGASVLLKDDMGTPTNERIRTGTGADVQLANNQTAFLVYDQAASLWYVSSVGGSATASTGGQKSFTMKINGLYGGSGAINGADGFWVAPTNCKITNVFIYVDVAGGSGTTDLDLKIKPFASGSFTSVFLTRPSVTAGAGANAWCGVGDTVSGCTAPVLSSLPFAVAAKSALRLDLITAQALNAAGCGLVVIYEEL